MVDRNLIREFNVDDAELEAVLAELGNDTESLDEQLAGTVDYDVNEINLYGTCS